MPRDWNGARVIFVCTGNICRSPMAAGLAEAMLRERGASAMAISMGTHGASGRSAARHAIAALEEIGIDISRHRAQGLNPTLLKMADVVFVMEPTHAAAVSRMAPGARVRELAHDHTPALTEVEDPVGGSLDDFRTCRELLKRCLQRALSSE